jgi:hypothetical protein
MLLENQFLKQPLKCVIIDPSIHKIRHTFVFLGAVPAEVSAACINQGSGATAAILRKYYGADYKKVLAINEEGAYEALLWGRGAAKGGKNPPNNQNLDLGCVRELAADKPTVALPVSRVAWAVEGLDENPDFAAEEAGYIVVVEDRGTLKVIDGLHYLKRAIVREEETIAARMLSRGELAKCTAATKMGGDSSFVEINDEDIEALLAQPSVSDIQQSKKPRSAIQTLRAADLAVEYEPGTTYITSEVHVFPEDKISELKDKLYISTNIPPYRQHLFYMDAAKNIYSSYTMQIDGIYSVDIRAINDYKEKISGIPIDKYLYNNRKIAKIEALDVFGVLANVLTDNTVFLVDLATFTGKIRAQLAEMVNDTYFFEMFYYGFILKYWPQITMDVFYDFAISETELQHKYPELTKNKVALNEVYRAEKEIINYNYKNIEKAKQYADTTGLSIAITQMIVFVTGNRTVINIRNLFDKLRVTRCIPEIHAYIEHNNKKYMLRKRHVRNGSDIQFPAGNLMKTGVTIAISLRKVDQDSFHARSSISTMENEQSRYLFLNIWPNGKYYVKTLWNEEDEFGFDDILKAMKRFIDPIIEGINTMGRYVFVSGQQLPIMTHTNIEYRSLNICIFWKKVLLGSAFKAIKNLWNNYARAQIISTRGLSQVDKYEFLFRKGIFEFDPTTIDKIVTASNNMIITNQYAYLTDNTIKQKWDQHYEGRIVRVYHRITDIKFEVSDIRQREFEIFHKYITVFVYKAVNDKNIKDIMSSGVPQTNIRKLKKLREQDPELFNLKKHGSKKVYSIICQNQRQPLIYTKDEIESMKPAEVQKLVEYWNFTLNQPSYYGCPSKLYPHLSFMVGIHPKSYCLPCCNKKQKKDASNKRARINKVCIQKHKFIVDEGANEGNISRHIINYGKDVDLGRLSKLPHSSIETLLNTALEISDSGYYIYGVPQHVPGAEHIGIVYAMAEAMKISMEDLIRKTVVEMKKDSLLFNILLGGTLFEYFNNMEELAETMEEIFINAKFFSKEIQKFRRWTELFAEIFHIIFHHVAVIIFDKVGTGINAEIMLTGSIKNEISYLNKVDPGIKTGSPNEVSRAILANHRFVVCLKKLNRVYPIFLLNPDMYFRDYIINRTSFGIGDKLVSLLFNMVHQQGETELFNPERPINLSVVDLFVDVNKKWNIRTKLINKRNMCYAVLLNHKSGGSVYCSVDYSPYIADNSTQISFEAFNRAAIVLPRPLLMEFISDMDKFIHERYSMMGTDMHQFSLVTPVKFISYKGEIIGAMAKHNLVFYFTAQSNKKGKHEANTAIEEDRDDDTIAGILGRSAKAPIVDGAAESTNAPIENIRHDFTDVNKAIIIKSPPVIDKRSELLGQALYENYLYQLFVIEFINYIDSERNKPIRETLIGIINSAKFKKSTHSFNERLKDILRDFPNDINTIQSQMVLAYRSGMRKRDFVAMIEETSYEFDRLTVNKLRSLPAAEVKPFLLSIADKITVNENLDGKKIKFPNVYMPCVDIKDESGYCAKNRLIINKPVETLVDILLADLSNSLKARYILDTVWSDNVVDYLSFTKVPSEIVTIYKLE